MKKTTTTSFRPSNILIIFIAFILGAVIYFFGAIGIDKIIPSAGATSGAFQQVTVQVKGCNCITIFEPDPMLSGGGTKDNPYVSNNTHVSMGFKANGRGVITIEDENGKILYTFNQTDSNTPEQIVTIDFETVGTHKLIIKINGAETCANGVETELYFRIGKLPPIIPDIPLPWLPGVPNTGYINIGGYAVQTYSLIISGVLFAIIAGFLLAAYRRREARNKTSIKVFVKKPRVRSKKSKSVPKKTNQRKR